MKFIIYILRYFKRYIMNTIQHYRMIYSQGFQRFISEKNNPKIILLDTPIHGNLGDQAIVLAERQFLEEDLSIKDIYEFTQQEYLLCEKEITDAMNKDDIILIHGGGFIGTLWQNEEDVLLQILDSLKYNKIIVFPQTVFFEKSKQGKIEEQKFIRVQKQCYDLTIFTRDQQSHDNLVNMGMSAERCVCVPDIVTYLKYDRVFERKNKVLLCLRSDKEKVFDEGILKGIIEQLNERGIEIVYTDTVVNQIIHKKERREAVDKKLDEFTQTRLVITDRLHGMLFAAITGTPCIAVDNVSKKVSGVYEWIKDLDYIKCVSDDQLNPALVNQMLCNRKCYYSNKNLEKYYRIIGEHIQNGRRYDI